MKNNKSQEKGIQLSLFEQFSDKDCFSLGEAITFIKNNSPDEKLPKEPSIRARIYEGIEKGLFERVISNVDGKVIRGVYKVAVDNTECMLIQGNCRQLNEIPDSFVDAIVTDHPYEDKAHIGGDRKLTDYPCFLYNQEDFNEKSRILKDGGFLVEFLPAELSTNWEYLAEIKSMSKKAGFEYYAKVPWIKGTFVSNMGRCSKNTEDILFMTKGKARSLRINAKKEKETALLHNLNIEKLDSEQIHEMLIQNNLPISYMSGTAKMLPTSFNYQPDKKKQHKAEKPVELYEDILSYIMKKGEIALDNFAGSGNLGIACLKSKINCILGELLDKNCDLIESKLSLFTL